MAAAKGGNSGSFKKGHKGGGRPALPAHVKEIVRHTKPQIIETYWKLANMSLEEVREYKPSNLLEAGILKCLVEFMKSGKTDYVSKLWAECHGRPKETLDLGLLENGNSNFSIDITKMKKIQKEETIAEVTRILVECGAVQPENNTHDDTTFDELHTTHTNN